MNEQPPTDENRQLLKTRPRALERYLGLMVLVTTIAVYAYLFHDRMSVFLEVRPAPLAVLLFLSVVMAVTTGWTNALVLRILNVRLSVLEFSSLTVLTTFGNYLGPMRAGTAVRAGWLKAARGVAISSFAGVLLANSVLLLFASAVFGVVLIVIGHMRFNVFSWPLFLACLTAIAGTVALRWLPLPVPDREGRVWNMIRLLLDGIDEIRRHHLGIAVVLGSIMVQYFVAALVVLFAYRSIGVDISLLASLIIGVFNAMSGYLSITPNNIGLQEAAIGYLGVVTGLTLEQSLLAAAVIRACHMVINFTLAPLASVHLLRPAGLTILGKGRPSPEGSQKGDAL